MGGEWRVPWPGPVADLPAIGEAVEARTDDGRESRARFSWRATAEHPYVLTREEWPGSGPIPSEEVTHRRPCEPNP